MTWLRIIAIEGIDGAGKTTLAEALDGRVVGDVVLRSVGEMTSALGPTLRSLLPSLSPPEKVFWFAADRQSVLEAAQVRWGSDARSVLLWDRYIDSARAYRWADVQLGRADESLLEVVEQVNSHFPPPDLVVVLDLTVEDAVGRRPRGSADHDGSRRRLLDAVRVRYAQLAAGAPQGRFVQVDALMPKEAVAASVVEIVARRM